MKEIEIFGKKYICNRKRAEVIIDDLKAISNGIKNSYLVNFDDNNSTSDVIFIKYVYCLGEDSLCWWLFEKYDLLNKYDNDIKKCMEYITEPFAHRKREDKLESVILKQTVIDMVDEYVDNVITELTAYIENNS